MGVTLYDVAKRAGVSPKTVSRVINNEKSVAEKTRQKVLTASEELGFVPNLWAQRLARGRSATLGLFFFGATPPYLMMVINSLMDVGEERGYQCSLFRLDTRDERQVEDVLQLFDRKIVDGALLTAPCGDSPMLNSKLTEMGIPYVALSPRLRAEDHSWIAATDELGAYESTKHLIALGHVRIGIIIGHPDHQAATDRYIGFKKALEEAGLPLDPELIQQGDWSFDSGACGARSLLSLVNPPTAIVAGDDDMAAGVLRAAQEAGIVCPHQLSVVGFDDVPMAGQISPALTTVRQPITEIARIAAEIVIDQIENDQRGQWGIMIPTELIIRDSTASRTVQ